MARVQRLLAAFAAACFLLGTLAALPAAAVGGPQIERFPKATSDTILKAHCHGFDVHFVYRATQLVTIAFSETTVFSAGSFNGTVARVLPNGHDSSTISFSFSGASSIDFNSGLVVQSASSRTVKVSPPAVTERTKNRPSELMVTRPFSDSLIVDASWRACVSVIPAPRW